MIKILSSSVLVALILTGCGSVNPNLPTNKVEVKEYNINIPYSGNTTFENIPNSETLLKVSHKLDGKHKNNLHKVIVPTINKINEEVKNRGYEYFQIVSPKQISNIEGFPINNKADLTAFLNPQYSMPGHTLNFLEGGKTLMDNQNSQDVINVPFTIFGTTEFELIIRMIKEPSYDEIVWNVKGEDK